MTIDSLQSRASDLLSQKSSNVPQEMAIAVLKQNMGSNALTHMLLQMMQSSAQMQESAAQQIAQGRVDQRV